VIHRIRNALTWRVTIARDAVRDRVYNRLARRGGLEFIRWRWPLGLRKPYQRPELLLRAPGLGIGDNLMLTPILREIKRRNPTCAITLLTCYPDLFRDNSSVNRVITQFDPAERRALRLGYDHMAARRTARALLAGARRPPGSTPAVDGSDRYAGYAHPAPPSRPLITIMAECVGMEFSATQLECATPDVSAAFRDRIAAIASPYVVVQPEASAWTPNKSWPVDRWVTVVRSLLAEYSVIEIGTERVLAGQFESARFVSLVGATSVNEMLHVIANAGVFAGPDSGGMHVANAFGVPSVIVFGGYSWPESFRYPRTTALVGTPPCAPCFLTSDCPFDRKCLSVITSDEVTTAIRAAMSSRSPR
jgi:ADP-heptose:LPS heptosyltransferase